MATLRKDEIQPNSDKRNELLIVLDYLLNETYDEKHATSQKKIVEYAEKNYGVYIRRDRIPQILLHLKQVTDKYPNKFPFVLKEVSSSSTDDDKDGTRKKYYVSQRAYSDKEIMDVISAIQADKQLDDDYSRELISKFMKNALNQNKVDSILSKLKKRGRKTSKLSRDIAEKINKLESYAIDNWRVWFRLYDKTDYEADHLSVELRRMIKERDTLVGYVYLTHDNGNGKTVVAIYFNEIRTAILTPADNIEIIDALNLNDITNRFEFVLDNRKFATIEEWIDNHYKGQDGLLRDFVFKYTLDDRSSAKYIESSFKKHFKRDITYEVRDREVEILDPAKDENGRTMLEKKTIVVRDAYATIRCNAASFRHWYMDFKIFNFVVIISPSRYGDLWLGPIVRKLTRRLNKYSEMKNYELVEKFKPEYEEERERILASHNEYFERLKEKGIYENKDKNPNISKK